MAPGPPAMRRVGRVLTYRKAATHRAAVPAGRRAGDGALGAGGAGWPARARSSRPRREGERARDWAWYSVGIGLSVYIVAFLVWLLLANDHAVARGVLRMGDLDRRPRVASRC